jgi:hypothetical protein
MRRWLIHKHSYIRKRYNINGINRHINNIYGSRHKRWHSSEQGQACLLVQPSA